MGLLDTRPAPPSKGQVALRLVPGVKGLEEKDRKLLSYLLNADSCHHRFTIKAGLQVSQDLFDTLWEE